MQASRGPRRVARRPPIGPISSTTPANPTTNPATLAQVIRSPGTKTMRQRQHQQRHHRHRDAGEARGDLLAGAQLSSAKGSAFEKTPMPMQCSQIRRPRGVPAGGSPAPVGERQRRRGSPPRCAIRAAAIDSGPKPRSARATPRNEPPQISPSSTRNSQASGEGAGRRRASGVHARSMPPGAEAAAPEARNRPHHASPLGRPRGIDYPGARARPR